MKRLKSVTEKAEPILCEVEAYEADAAVLHILEEMEADTEPASKLYLFQGLPKSDKMELIVQKAVELGVYQVIPVAMERSVVRLDDKKAAKKADRWNAIAESVSKGTARKKPDPGSYLMHAFL